MLIKRITFGSAIACLLAYHSAVLAEQPAEVNQALESTATPIMALAVEPTKIVLHAANRRQQLLVTAERADGKFVDLTRDAIFSLSESGVARIERAALVGICDGATMLTVSAGGKSVTTSVQVRGFAEYPKVHFGSDVVPVFSKLGCNSGGCHGRASGQNGFKLSVFGFDLPVQNPLRTELSAGRRDSGRPALTLKLTATVARAGGGRWPGRLG